MPTNHPPKKTLHQVALEQREKHAAWSKEQEERVAARKAAWESKTPEQKAARIEAVDRTAVKTGGIFGLPLIRPFERAEPDEFTGMDEDEAEFLRDWLGSE